jgi:hypothetical protein
MTKKHFIPGGNYENGYGKPPKDTRFKKGQSGNPRGRPRGAKNKQSMANYERLKGMIYDEIYRKIMVNEEHGSVQMPMIQAVLRSAVVKAAKGDHRSQKLVIQLGAEVERADLHEHRKYHESVIAYKKEWEDIFSEREHLGSTGPEPLPHPDHIHVDWKTGETVVWGPKTREEKRQFDAMLLLEEKKIKLGAELKETVDPASQKEIEDLLLEINNALETLLQNWRK